MNKLLIIGIDSLAPAMLEKYAKVMPNLTRIHKVSPKITSNSVFPVDSIPAWVSIYTGLNPAQHGIVKTFDIFDVEQQNVLNTNIDSIRGKTFWDYVSASGRRICVLFPLLAYPPWPINGIFISNDLKELKNSSNPWATKVKLGTYPDDIAIKYDIHSYMKGITGKHPGLKNLPHWANLGKAALLEQAKLGLNICEKERWDLFFIYFSLLDIVQHRLWRFSDFADPSYPGKNSYETILQDFHHTIDDIVGNFLKISPMATILIISDHGHGMRPVKTVNINKMLFQNKILFKKTQMNLFQYSIEAIKRVLLDIVSRFELDYWLVEFSTKSKFISTNSKKIYMSSSRIKQNNYLACLSAFAGVKSYSHGGIEIIRSNITNENDYEKMRERIISLLLSLRDPTNQKPLVEWACKRESLYSGQYLDVSYPDVVFNLANGYGTGWDIYGPLFGRAYDHNLAPGGHKKNAVFMISNLDNRLVERYEVSLMDIAPSVIDFFGIDYNENCFDGKSIFIKTTLSHK